jgi:predicted nucleotidyltransferase
VRRAITADAPHTLESVPATIEQATLSDAERRALERLPDALADALGDDFVALWLYGSRARGEEPGPERDIDLMVVARGGRREYWRRVWEVIERLAPEVGADPILFAPHVADPSWIEGRREINSFFIQEVDRDKIVLRGSA